MLGWETLQKDIRVLENYWCEPQRADAMVQRLQRRLQHAASHIPATERKTAMWLTINGGKMYGGSRGSSYHDMLRLLVSTTSLLVRSTFLAEFYC